MSQPAARVIRERTVECPTCGARRYRPCVRVGANDTLDAYEEHGPHVAPHAARRRAEKALADQRKESS